MLLSGRVFKLAKKATHFLSEGYRELGSVTWLRHFDDAIATAQRESKPILLLFQEVPGCSTCVNFGQDSLSHPLMVELIENSFVPLAIFNNIPGQDANVLARFGEPAWNNPVLYALDADGTPLLPKLSNRYDPIGLLDFLGATLRVRGASLPAFADLLRADLQVSEGLVRQATFATPCFWSGETSLAQHPSVLTTLAGWADGDEAVLANYDPEHPTAAGFSAFAEQEGFQLLGQTVFTVDKTPQYYLSKTLFAYLPLTPAQCTRINFAIPYEKSPQSYLSPQQQTWLEWPDLRSYSHANAYQADFKIQWHRLSGSFANLRSEVES